MIRGSRWGALGVWISILAVATAALNYRHTAERDVGKDGLYAVGPTSPSLNDPSELAPTSGQAQAVGGQAQPGKNSLAFKRGAGVWGKALNTKLAWVKALGDLGWYYDWWHAEPNAAVGAAANQKGMEFVPMVWGRDNHIVDVPGSAKAVLGFNEPNVKTQSGISPQEAAKLWGPLRKEAKARGLRLGSPSASPCPSLDNSKECLLRSPFDWLDQWIAACKAANSTCADFDFLATHFYSCSTDNLAAYLQELYQRYKKPIWLTEFSCCLSGSGLKSIDAVARQIGFARAAMTLLDSLPYVERYAWFAPRTDGFACLGPSANLLTDSNELTTLGEIYVGHSIDENTLQEPIASAVLAPVAQVDHVERWAALCGPCDSSKTFHSTLQSLKRDKEAYAEFVHRCRQCGFEDEWNVQPLL